MKSKKVQISTKKPTAWDVMAHQALNPSSGIEPEFNTFYVRRRKINDNVTTGSTK